MLASLCSAQAASGAVASAALTLTLHLGLHLGLASTAFAQCPNPLVAWGQNNEGQCNVPQALGTVKSMAAGDTWSVAFARGRFATWGATPSGGPQWVQPPQDATLGGGVPTLSVGDRFTVALNAQNGRIACWGDNTHGQCNVPSDFSAAKFVAAGMERVLAIHAQSGHVFAWGRNSYGEGIVPKNLGPCVSVAAGNRHSVAVRADGQLRCWGSNFQNACDLPAETTGYTHASSRNFHSLAQRGDFSITAWGWNPDGRCTIPAALGEVRDGGISAGVRHSAAIVWDAASSNWTVRCWGSNESGACNVPAGLTDVVAVAAGYDRTMALRANGRIEAWGRNDFGQSTVPSASAETPDLISGGSEFSIASSSVAPYEVFAWGNNQYGQHHLAQPPANQRYTQLSAGWSHVVGLLEDGTLRCAGGSWAGQCGNMPALSNIRQVAASNSFTLAVDNNNRIHAWEQILGGFPAGFWDGREARFVAVNSETQAMVRVDGNFYCVGGWYPYTSSPCDDSISGNYGDITQLAVGGRHLLALRSDGSIYVWTSLTDNPNLNVPGGIGTAVQIAAGYSHSVALNSAGRVFCWGENHDGQCNIPADIGKVKKIAAGLGHTIAIRDFSTPFTDGAFDDSTSDKSTCPYGRGDLNADGFIDATDLSTLFALWGATDAEIGDLSGNGIVDGDDLTQLLSNWNAPEV